MPLFSNHGIFIGDRISRWNRREIHIGQALDEVNRIRDVLSFNKIKNSVRIISRLGGNILPVHASTPTSNTHYIYVHKNDEEKARFLIKR